MVSYEVCTFILMNHEWPVIKEINKQDLNEKSVAIFHGNSLCFQGHRFDKKIHFRVRILASIVKIASFLN